jgi:UbiD family decarboxylase
MSTDGTAGPLMLRSWIDVAAERHPDKPYIVCVEDGRTFTYGELRRTTRKMGEALANAGIGPNDRIALLSGNSIEHLICYLGVMSYGATICTVYVEMNRNHLARILGALKPRLMLFEPQLNLDDVLSQSPAPKIPLTGEFAGEIARYTSERVCFESEARDDACILFTSGTRDRPKGVVLSYRELMSNAEPLAEGLGMTAGDRIYDFRSFNWCSAQVLSVLAPLSRGATLLLGRKFSRSRFFQHVAEHRATVTAGNPTTLNMLLNAEEAPSREALASLRFIISSSAPLLLEDWRRFEQRFGIPIAQSYGCSEIGWIAANPGTQRRFGSVGKPLPYHRLAIVNGCGEPLAAGETGEIEVGGFADIAYRSIAEDGAVSIDAQNRFRTGDLGFLDDDGFLYLTGRKKELIIRGGINISPLEIDAVLAQRPEVLEAATVGIPDRIYGEEVLSFVVLQPSAAVTSNDLIAHCAHLLPASKVPKQIVLRRELTKTARGKLDRRAMAAAWVKVNGEQTGEALRHLPLTEFKDMQVERAAKLNKSPHGAPRMNIAVTLNPKARVAYDDLRQWIAEADKLGELVRGSGYSWQEDIGMAAELLQHDPKGPVALFDDIPGYPRGFRVLTNFFGGRRQNMTLGHPADLNKIELSEAFLADFQKICDTPMPYRVVDIGPIMENVIEGDAVDVMRFPTPVWHDRDEGRRYIGTGSFNVTRDPDEGWINCGTYRVMIHDAKRLGFYISPGKHGRIHRDKYAAMNKPMPVCIVIGGDPLTFLMACTEVPYGICEYEIAGAYRGRPQEVVLGKHTGLPIPANAEIVLEGFVQPGNYLPEGPFGEWTGYYGSKMRSEPVLDVRAIYHRNNPILLGCPPQRPPEEQARYRAVVRSALLKQELKKTGLPDVVATWCHEAGGSRQLTAVSIKQRYPGHARQAGHLAAMCRSVAYAGKYVVVVDDDVDVSNLEELMWAVCTRSDPATSIDFINKAWSTPLDPSIPPERKAQNDFTNSRAIIDACRPFHWKDDYPIVNMPLPETARRTKEMFSWMLDGTREKTKVG